MAKMIERSLLMGLGILSLTRKKAETIVEELVKEGEARRDESRELVDKLTAHGDEEREALKRLVRGEIEKTVTALNLATKEDIEALNKKLDGLAAKSKGN